MCSTTIGIFFQCITRQSGGGSWSTAPKKGGGLRKATRRIANQQVVEGGGKNQTTRTTGSPLSRQRECGATITHPKILVTSGNSPRVWTAMKRWVVYLLLPTPGKEQQLVVGILHWKNLRADKTEKTKGSEILLLDQQAQPLAW